MNEFSTYSPPWTPTEWAHLAVAIGFAVACVVVVYGILVRPPKSWP